jgi:hypothetical protein
VRLCPLILSASRSSACRHRAYGLELSRYVIGDDERRPPGDVLHLLPHKRGWYLPAVVSEKHPNQPERRDDPIGIDPLARTVRRTLFSQRELYRPAMSVDRQFLDRFVP